MESKRDSSVSAVLLPRSSSGDEDNVDVISCASERERRRLKRNEYQRCWYHKKKMGSNRAPSVSAVLPSRSISGDENKVEVIGCASLVSVAGKRRRILCELQVEDTEDPWEMQRLHDAWLAKEFFYKKKKKYFYGPRECPDCGTLLASSVVARHRRFNCKSRQPLALDGVRQGRPADKDAVLESLPPPEAPLEAPCHGAHSTGDSL